MSEGICGSNLYVKPVEVCSFAALKKLLSYSGDNKYLYDINTIYSSTLTTTAIDLNKNFRDLSNNEFLYKYDDTKKDLCFPIRPDDKNSPYAINCVLATNSPYFTYNSKKKTCSPIPNLNLPDDFEYQEENDKTYIYYKNKSDPEGNYSFASKPKKAYCENKWYDWIITPNYHFGNKYEKDSGIYSPQDVRRCYKPCLAGYMPYIDKNGSNICVKKEIANDGYYSNKLDYSPIALINLIGNNEITLNALYYLMYLYEKDKFTTDSTISANYKVIDEYNPSPPISGGTLEKFNDLYENYLKEDAKNAYNEIKETVKKNIINEPFFHIKNSKYELNKHVLTYKHPNFKEEDATMITLRGLNENKVTTNDAILLHTWFISYNYYFFIESTFFEDEIANMQNNRKHLFNINNNLNFLLDTIEDNYKEHKGKYKERLANILYQAINVCYNNKTDFSKNLIRMTKDAFDKFNKKENQSLRYNFIEYFNDHLFTHTTINPNYIKFKRFWIIETDVISPDKKTAGIDANTHSARYGKTLLDNFNGFQIQYYKNETDITKNDLYQRFLASKPTTTKTEDKINLQATYNSNKDYFSFFREETQEKINNNPPCIVGEIYDFKKKTCVVCGTYCKTGKGNTCSTDKRCEELCQDNCKKPTLKTKCGKSKNTIEQTEENSLEEKKEDNDLIDINIPKTSKGIEDTFNTGINIFFLILSIYLLFIFYDIFKETFSVVGNFIIYYFKYIYNYFANFFSWNKYEVKNIMAEYKQDKIREQFSKIVEKTANLRNE